MHSTTFFTVLIAASTAIAIPIPRGVESAVTGSQDGLVARKVPKAAATSKNSSTKPLSDENIEQIALTIQSYGELVNAETVADPSDQKAMAALKAKVKALPANQKNAIKIMIKSAKDLDAIFDKFNAKEQRAVLRYVLQNLTPVQEAFLTLALSKNFDEKLLESGSQAIKLSAADLTAFNKLDIKRRMELIAYALAEGMTQAQIDYITKIENNGLSTTTEKGTKKKSKAGKSSKTKRSHSDDDDDDDSDSDDDDSDDDDSDDDDSDDDDKKKKHHKSSKKKHSKSHKKDKKKSHKKSKSSHKKKPSNDDDDDDDLSVSATDDSADLDTTTSTSTTGSAVSGSASLDDDDDDDDDSLSGSTSSTVTTSSTASDDDDDDDDDDATSAATSTKSSASTTAASDDDADADTDAAADGQMTDAQLQLYISCLSKSDAKQLLKDLKAQGATDSQISQASAQIPSLNQKNWKAPSNCPATTSKRSLADLD